MKLLYKGKAKFMKGHKIVDALDYYIDNKLFGYIIQVENEKYLISAEIVNRGKVWSMYEAI